MTPKEAAHKQYLAKWYQEHKAQVNLKRRLTKLLKQGRIAKPDHCDDCKQPPTGKGRIVAWGIIRVEDPTPGDPDLYVDAWLCWTCWANRRKAQKAPT